MIADIFNIMETPVARGRHKDWFAESEQDKDLTTIGGRIRHARIMEGLTQQDLADALPNIHGRKKSRASIAQYETKSPPGLDVIADLATILNRSPCYLAFGSEAAGVAPTPTGQRVPINPLDDELGDETYAVFPRSLLDELGAGSGRLELVRLAVDAPAFGIRRNDYLLLDTSISHAKSDGELYAVSTSAGMAVVRSEPRFSKQEVKTLNIVTGQGGHYSLSSELVEVAGRLVVSLQSRSSRETVRSARASRP